MKFENIRVMNFDNALRGMRNPKESYHLKDTIGGVGAFNFALDKVTSEWMHFLNYDIREEEYRKEKETAIRMWLLENGILYSEDGVCDYTFIGPKDMKLAQQLILGGSEHRKFLRQVFITVDITAPLYWWKEFDTYKVGTTANSTSTMHKIDSKPIGLPFFEIGDYCGDLAISEDGKTVQDYVENFIDFLELLRLKYKETEDKKYWKELIRWLPEGWLQTRTVTMSYENAINMANQREFHKLIEWSKDKDAEYESYIQFLKELPYADELIFTKKLFQNDNRGIFPKVKMIGN